jgi:hypothetical protein
MPFATSRHQATRSPLQRDSGSHLGPILSPAVLNYGWKHFIDWGNPDGLDLMFLKSSLVLTGRSPRETTLLRPLRISFMSEAEPDPIVDESEKNPSSQ